MSSARTEATEFVIGFYLYLAIEHPVINLRRL